MKVLKFGRAEADDDVDGTNILYVLALRSLASFQILWNRVHRGRKLKIITSNMLDSKGRLDIKKWRSKNDGKREKNSAGDPNK